MIIPYYLQSVTKVLFVILFFLLLHSLSFSSEKTTNHIQNSFIWIPDVKLDIYFLSILDKETMWAYSM